MDQFVQCVYMVENTQTSHVSGKVRILHHTYLWYSPNILAKFETRSPFLLFKPTKNTTKNSYAVAMFMDIITGGLRVIFS